MNRNISCPHCKSINQINNIEKYFGKKARIYCLNSACNKEIILDLAQEAKHNEQTEVIQSKHSITSSASLTYKNEAVENNKLMLFKGDNVIGRSSKSSTPADFMVNGDPYLSRRQFLIKYHNGEFSIMDCNSKNQTYLNGSLLMAGEEIFLVNNDQIKAGQTTFIYNQ